MNFYSVPGTILGTRNTTVKERKKWQAIERRFR